jgi:DNA-binding transcriptional ArsR family regulator
MTFETAVPDPDAGLDEVSALLAALAHPVRLRILAGLLSGDCCVGTMVQCLGLPQPLVSRHLAVLRDAGIVVAEVEGRRRQYRVVDPRVQRILCCVIGGAATPGASLPHEE